jgi:hypothetical protein
MATPKIVADFETQLATALSIGGTSFTLASATDDDGVALPTGKYYFTINNGTSQKEYVVGTLTGTAVTDVSNVTRQGVESSGVDRAHRVGTSVIISDFLTYKNYIDETTIAGAADGNTTTKGVFEAATLAEVRAGTALGSTGAALVTTPDVLDDLPTEDEKAAMAGGGSLGTPSAANKFATEDYFANATQVVEFTSSDTWTKDAGLQRIRVQAWGAGGGGGRGDGSSAGTGGGGGGYFEKWLEASELGATETVTIGTGGAGAATSGNGSAGSNTTFGSLLTAYPGTGGGGNSTDPTSGSGGDIQASGTLFRGAGSQAAGTPGIGVYWGGAAGGKNNGGAANALFGGAGGGSSSGTSQYSGGTSIYGGNGGAGGNNVAGTVGSVPGGGGGGANDAAGGAGGAGKVIVTEYYV